MATEGTFILADIGGYTGFLTGVGIEHGKEITSHLLNSLLKCNRGRWKLANIEGDCLFLYREGREPPAELLDHLHTMYEDFCDRTIDIAQRASCPCGACTRTNDLSLKFIVHAGQFDRQRIGNREELIGPDIVIAHRLLKNSAGLSEYALLTEGYTLGVTPDGLPSVNGGDDAEGIGRVPWVALDLAPVRAELEDRRQVFVDEHSAKLAVTAEIDAPPEVVFDALMDTAKRSQWQRTIKSIEAMEGKRGEIGEVHRCIHDNGAKMIHVTVAIDREGRRRTEKIWLNRLMKDVHVTTEARALPEGRTLGGFFATYESAIPVVSHIAVPVIMMVMKRLVKKDIAGLKEFCEERVRVGR
jgi:hypothetical protein